MRVIITGGSGFIGSHAVRHFVESGDNVLNIDKLTYASNLESTKLSKFVNLDIKDTKSLLEEVEKFCPDVIVNFAAETHVDNSINDCNPFIESNIFGTTSVLKVCKELKIKLLHISTDEVYGPASSNAFTEDSVLNPMNPYSVTKAAADLMIKSWRNTFGIDYIIVRPSNNYGPGQYKEKLIPKFLDCIENSKKFPLYGAGDQEREWTYVEDTAKIVRSILNKESIVWNNTYNLSSGISLKNNEVLRKVLNVYNKKKNKNIKFEDIVVTSQDRPGHDKRYSISSKKLSRIIKTNYTSFDDGLEKTINGMTNE